MGMGTYVHAFFPDNDEEIVRVHGAHCTHVHRDWRSYGAPVKLFVESRLGIERQLKARKIRYQGIRVLPCAGIPVGYWSRTPDGEPLTLLSTRSAARRSTARIKGIEMNTENFRKVTSLAPYLSERYGFKKF